MAFESPNNRYGYIQNTDDIPYLSNPNIEKEDKKSFIRILGELGVVFAASGMAGGLARRGNARAIAKIAASNTDSLRRRFSRELVDISKKLDDIQGLRTGIKGSEVEQYSILKKFELAPRGGSGPFKYLPDNETTKAHLMSRGIAAARRIPYELPGYYLTSRALLNKKEYEEKIKSGKFNPKNPVDVIGDFALSAVGYTITDAAFSVAGPFMSDAYKTTLQYSKINPNDTWARLVKLNRDALGQNIRDTVKWHEKQLVKATTISQTFEDLKMLQFQRSTGATNFKDQVENMSLGRMGMVIPDRETFGKLKTIYKQRNLLYEQMGPAAEGPTLSGANKPLINLTFNRLQSEITALGRLSKLYADDTDKFIDTKNPLYPEVYKGLVAELAVNNARRGGIHQKEVYEEAAALFQTEYLRGVPLGRALTGQGYRTGGARAVGESITSDDVAKRIFNNLISERAGDGTTVLIRDSGAQKAARALSSTLAGKGIDISEGQARYVIDDMFGAFREEALNIARRGGRYRPVGFSDLDVEQYGLPDIQEMAVKRVKAISQESTKKYAQGLGYAPVIGSRSGNEDAFATALSLLGKDPAQLKKISGTSAEALRILSGSKTHEQALEFANNILRVTGRGAKSVDDTFNAFGLRRMSFMEQLVEEKAYRTHLGPINKQAYALFDPSKRGLTLSFTDSAMGGTGRATDKIGSRALKNAIGKHQLRHMYGETGLYKTVAGDTVDFRPLIASAYKVADFASNVLQVPILGMNPLQLAGSDTWLESLQANRVRMISSGTNRTLYAETKEAADLFNPMMVVKGHGITYDTKLGEVKNVGRFSSFRNVTSMGQRDARMAEQEGRYPGWWQTEEVPKSRRRKLVEKVLGEERAESLAGMADISEDKSDVLWYKLKRWQSKRKGSPRYAPNIVERIAKTGSITEEGVRELKDIRKFLSSQVNDESALFLSTRSGRIGLDAPLSGQAGGHTQEIIHGLRREVASVVDDAAKVDSTLNREFIREVEGRGGELTVGRTLQSQLTKLEDISEKAAVRQLSRREQAEFRTAASRIRLMLASINGDASLLARIDREAEAFFRAGELSGEAYGSIKAQLAATKLYLKPPKEGIPTTGLGSYLDEIGSTREALDVVLGHRVPKTGNPVIDAINKIENTALNSNFMSSEAGFIEEGKLVHNIFGKSDWIAVRPFSWKSGISSGAGGVFNKLTGNTVYDIAESPSHYLDEGYEYIDRDTASFRKSAIGAVFGRKFGGEQTTATMLGWRSVDRVINKLDIIGLGLSPHKYSSPFEYFAIGGLGRRVAPIVGAGLAFSTLSAIPGVGAQGVMGAGAFALGPGLSSVRAATMQGMNALPFSGPLSQQFWQTYSEVTGAQEDDFSTSMGRTFDQNWNQWMGGDVPVRQGRHWALGGSAWKGGRVSFYQPNWYRRYMSQYQYTEDFKGNPLEWALYGTDLSVGKYVDPYHYERKHYNTRPYPVTGDLFTGPWGIATPILNATIGNVIKPKVRMHNSPEELAQQQAISVYSKPNTGGVVQLFTSGMIKQGNIMSSPGYSGQGPFAQSMTGGIGGIGGGAGGEASSMISNMNTAGQVAAGVFIQGGPKEQYFGYTPDVSMAGKRNLSYFAGETGYMVKEFAGIYGFLGGGMIEGYVNKDFVPSNPMLESADRAYGMERAFWDLNLGGFGDAPIGKGGSLELSEITRRFIPHRRKNIETVNNIPNTSMPEWMPGPGSLIDFRTGDPFVKIPKGEARLPGSGYERLNKLHPDQYGEYGAIDRMKILANVNPWSDEYRYWSKVAIEGDLTEEERSIVSEAKRQASQRKKRLNIRPRIWSGDMEKFDTTALTMSEFDPNIFMTASGQTVRLAGVRFSKTEEGMAQAQAFAQNFLTDDVELYRDVNASIPLANREKTIDVIAKRNGVNVNKELMDRIESGEIIGGFSRSSNYADLKLKYGSGWEALGHIEETISRAEIPFFKSKFGKYDAADWLEEKMVYGKQWQPWESPVESFVQPAFDMFTKVDSPFSFLDAGVKTGVLASMFVRGGQNKMIAGAVGAAAGAGLNIKNQVVQLITGQKWVPERRKKEWEIEEYMDAIKYVKYSNLYQQQRQKAIEEEGLDIEQLVDEMGNLKQGAKDLFRSEWEAAPVGAKPAKAVSRKILERIGPEANMALMYRKKMQSTMFGAPLSGDFMSIQGAVPKRYRPIFQDLLEAPVSDRKKILGMLPRGMRRMLQAQWGMPIEKMPSAEEYFKKHTLPSPRWEGWLPQVNIDEVTIKVMKQEGIDTAEFGLYETEVKEAMSMPWTAPHPHLSDGRYMGDIIKQLDSMGVGNIDIEETDTPGIHLDARLRMLGEIRKEYGI